MADHLAVDFVAKLAAKGVTLKVRNNRLWIQPGTAYKQMSDEDRAILRHHRAALKAIAIEGLPDVQKARPKPRRKRPDRNRKSGHTTTGLRSTTSSRR